MILQKPLILGDNIPRSYKLLNKDCGVFDVFETKGSLIWSGLWREGGGLIDTGEDHVLDVSKCIE